MIAKTGDIRNSIGDLRTEIDRVIGSVAQCADVADRINQLVGVRDRAQNAVNHLTEMPGPLETDCPEKPAEWLQRMKHFVEPVAATDPEIRRFLGPLLSILESLPTDPGPLHDLCAEVESARVNEIKTLRQEIAGWNQEISTLYGPFQPAETQVRTFIAELRGILDSLPVEPHQLRDIRAEIKKLSLWKATLQSFPPLFMRSTYADLLIVSRRLDELLAYLPKPSATPLVRPFPVPEGGTWNDVSIRFTGDHAVQITVGGVSEARNYVEMGFEDRRKRTVASTSPNLAWSLLREFAKQGGVIRILHQAGSKTWPSVETGIKQINKKLGALFRIAGNPIQYHRQEKSYKTKFHLIFPDHDQL